MCTLNFVNKGMEDVNVSKIFQTKNAIGLLLLSLQDYKNLPLTTYKVAATIRNKAFNEKQKIESIELQCDPDHGHINTGDLCFMKNQKLESKFRKFRKFSKFR